MFRKLLIVITITVSFYTTAHQDTIIKLESDGTLIGLPNTYLPAKFDSSRWVVSIGNKGYEFPECVSAELAGIEPRDIKITASWYNPILVISDTEVHRFPSYLKFALESKSFSVLIDLDTAKPFDKKSSEYIELTNEQICQLFLSNKSKQ